MTIDHRAAVGQFALRGVFGRSSIGAAGLVVVTLLSGCSSGRADPPATSTPTPSVTTSGGLPSPAQTVQEQVLAQYRGFWSVLTPTSEAVPTRRRQMLTPYAADPELKSLLAGMARADRKGEVFYGRDLPRPTINMLSETRGIAVIRDCQDSSHAGNKDRSTGRRLTVGVLRNLVVATMHRQPDGQWRVVYVSYPKGSC